MTSPLNPIGRSLANNLERVANTRADAARSSLNAPKVNVVGAGGALTAAYEQLRNAAENTEEHLLLQNAIKRFYTQLFLTRDEQLIRASGNELAIELTLAGYLQNNTLTKEQISTISRTAREYYHAYETLQTKKMMRAEVASQWVLDVLAVSIENILNDHGEDESFVEFAYEYFAQNLSKKSLFGRTNVADFGAALYAAVYHALLKADDATIRHMLLKRYQVPVDDITAYADMNRHIDRLLSSKTTDTLQHAIDRQGAPLRILRRMIHDRDDIVKILPNRNVFLEEYEQQIGSEYTHVNTRIRRAIVRSVVFLIITKFLIGIAIEVPYDIWAHGSIIWQPLLINLIFPPLYMVLLRLTHTLPSYANTTALVDAMDAMLYGERATLMKTELKPTRYSSIFSVVYVMVSLAVFACVTWLLYYLQFSFVHILIFFVFISAASFLGFRLSRLIRELEVVHSSQNSMTFIRDLLYLPFVVVGRWMSDKYSRLNIITLILDMLIELPLKTVLRLIRQWTAFIDERKDRLS